MSYMKRLDLLGVQAFICIAEAGSFSAAAKHLNISQTALTRRLQKLEAGLGLQLIQRTTRSMIVTRAGMDFLPRAVRTVRELAAALDDLRGKGSQEAQEIMIGCLPTVAATRLAKIIREYGRRYPNNTVQVLDKSATEIREAVLRSELDFAISVLASPHRDLVSEMLFTEPLVVVCPAKHRLASKACLDWKDLQGEPLIAIGALSGNRLQTEQVIAAERLDLRFTYEVQHLATAVGLVAGGAGLAILPASATRGAASGQLVSVPLLNPSISRTIEIFHRRDKPLSSGASALRRMIVTALSDAPQAQS